MDAIDALAEKFGVTRNDLMEAVLKRYLEDRGEDVETMLAQIGRREDAPSQLDIFQ